MAGVGPGDLVLDVGAGTGAITASLVAAGAAVVAVELHPDRVAILRQRFAGCAVTVVRTDAADLRLPRRPFIVVANPPFGITTALLRRLLSPASRLERASVVLPPWAAVRWATGRGVGGLTSRRQWELTLGPTVPASAFRPRSPGDCRVLRIRRT